MNALQSDELIALDAIFPTCVSHTTAETCTRVQISLPTVDLGTEEELDVWDWEHSEPVASGSRPPAASRVAQRGGGDRTPPETAALPRTPTAAGQSRRRGRGLAADAPPSPPAPLSPPRPAVPLADVAPALPRTHSTKIARATLTLVPPPRPVLPARLPPPPVADRAPAIAKTLRLRYLPPLELFVRLPVGYPEHAPPEIEVRDPEGWLGETARAGLEKRMRGVWAAEECLWVLVDMLQELVSTLDLKFPLVLRETHTSTTPLRPSLSSRLVAHNRTLSSTVFKAENFSCGICLEDKKGARCVRLEGCSHVFCHSCLLSYFTLLITEGLVRSVHCPAIPCVRARAAYSKANPPALGFTEPVYDAKRPGEVAREEVEALVGTTLASRWETLKEKVRVESDPAMSFCPREKCQAPVPRQDDDVKLRVCDACSYAFCVFCKKGCKYPPHTCPPFRVTHILAGHGTQTSCAIPQSTALASKYLLGSAAEQAELELRYGAANIKRLVAVWEEDRVNREYLEANSMQCPGCLVQIEKSVGCSHMLCVRCQTHFCFRCGDKLSGLNPYLHYSTPANPCYNKLFDFIPGQEPPVPDEWHDIIGEVAQPANEWVEEPPLVEWLRIIEEDA